VDTSGPALARICREKLGAEIVTALCVPDERDRVAETLRDWARNTTRPDLILTTGGTGLAQRDVTPEATADVLERRLPALLELARLRYLSKTPRAFLSRGEAGTLGRTLIVNLPGSERGAVEILEALLDVLPHALSMIAGDTAGHIDTRPSPSTHGARA
jgi:molybdenum cofactor synthesis domain-containing protein